MLRGQTLGQRMDESNGGEDYGFLGGLFDFIVPLRQYVLCFSASELEEGEKVAKPLGTTMDNA